MEKKKKIIKCIDNLNYPFIRVGKLLDVNKENDEYYWVELYGKSMKMPKCNFEEQDF